MTDEHSHQPPDLTLGNVSHGLSVATVSVTLFALALMWPIRVVHQDFATSNGADAVPFIVDDVLYGQPCAANAARCAEHETALLVSAYMSRFSFAVIQAAYARRPFATLCLFSPGGSVSATIDMARWLQQRDIEVCVSEAFRVQNRNTVLNNLYCYSSCAHLLASARQRVGYGSHPVVGVHDMYYQVNIPLTDRTFRAESDLLALAMDARLTRIGIPYKTVRAFSAPKSSEIYELTVGEMNDLELLTEHRLLQ